MSFLRQVIRKANIADIPFVANLIGHSFLAIADSITDPGQRARADEKLRQTADDLIKNEISESAFMKTYFEGEPLKSLWVFYQEGEGEREGEGGGSSNNGGVLGCIGIKPHQDRQGAELIRMSVLPSLRGKRIGEKLVQHCLSYCKDFGIERVYLTTANMRAASFYKKHGFHTYSYFTNPFIEPDIIWEVVRQVAYLSNKGPLVDKVAIVGGTHGNELIGVELVREWESNNAEIARESFESRAIVGNPRAIEANKRFIDLDLNRQFGGLVDVAMNPSTIAASSSTTTASTTTASTTATATAAAAIDKRMNIEVTEAYELTRARELNLMLGPKSMALNELPKRTKASNGFIIDCHSSTSNVGIMAMICAIDSDVLATRLVNYLKTEVYPDLKITSRGNKKSDTMSVDSITDCGIALEVGPLIHGTMDPVLMAITKDLITKSLDYIDRYNKLEFPTIPPHIVGGNFPIIEYYLFVSVVKFPEDEKGNKIPGFRVAPQLEKKDWCELRIGDTCFVRISAAEEVEAVVKFELDASITKSILPKYREINTGSESEDAYYPVFVNEAAYASSNIAFCVYKKVRMYVI